MKKETREIFEMFLALYEIDRCLCYGEMIVGACPIHGWSGAEMKYKAIMEKLNEKEKETG